jgi:hypothetical protein
MFKKQIIHNNFPALAVSLELFIQSYYLLLSYLF